MAEAAPMLVHQNSLAVLAQFHCETVCLWGCSLLDEDQKQTIEKKVSATNK